MQPDKTAFDRRRVIHADGVFVIKLSIAVTIYCHPVRHQRVESNHLSFTVTDDLCAVSYTHLDVYKRQRLNSTTVSAERTTPL